MELNEQCGWTLIVTCLQSTHALQIPSVVNQSIFLNLMIKLELGLGLELVLELSAIINFLTYPHLPSPSFRLNQLYGKTPLTR
jgi:hypothetical protein